MKFIFLLFSCIISLIRAQDSPLSTYEGDFVVEFRFKTDEVFIECSVNDAGIVIDAIQTSTVTLGNEYLEKFGFPGTFETYMTADAAIEDVWVPRERQLDSNSMDEKEEQDSIVVTTHNEQRALLWNFNIFFGGVWGCRVCYADNSDGGRRLQSGKKFRMKTLFNYVNSQSNKIMMDAISNTSATCQKSASSWKVDISQIVI